jgi:hypothetical protein
VPQVLVLLPVQLSMNALNDAEYEGRPRDEITPLELLLVLLGIFVSSLVIRGRR